MAGGAATTSGTTFQEDVGRWLVCHVLAESDAPAIAGLPAGTCFDHLACEAATEIDDTTLRTSDDGIVFFQAKTSLPFSANNAMLLSVFEQFAKQFVAVIKEASGSSRSIDPVVDRFVLAVSHKAPATTRDPG